MIDSYLFTCLSNVNTRTGIGMNQDTRTQTKWQPFGGMHIPPFWWIEHSKCFTQRALDMLEILHASAARDPESKDSNFSSHSWNISQNVSKEKHRTAVPGIASCITPGGDIFLPHLGRPLLGSEKLLLQGKLVCKIIINPLSSFACNHMSSLSRYTIFSIVTRE